ncbi:MAG: phage tail protein [Anaerolineae bacterium]|nr:phage tail protein [Anaerolineae bacterium]
MDANGLRFWLLAEKEAWRLDENAYFDPDSRRLQLRATPADFDPPPEHNSAAATSRLDFIPAALDAFGTWAFFDPVKHAIMAAGAFDEAFRKYGSRPGDELLKQPVGLLPVPIDQKVTDLAMGFDSVLYMAIGGRVVMLDRRERWRPVMLGETDFSAWRLAAAPDGGVWVLDREHRKLGRVTGMPLPQRPYRPYSPDNIRPCEENPNPPTLTVIDGAALPATEILAGIACSLAGRLALLSWINVPDAGTELEQRNARIRLYHEALEQFGDPLTLEKARFPYSFAWVNDSMIAVLLTTLETEAQVYNLDDLPSNVTLVRPVGNFYPLHEHNGQPFLKGVTLPPHYMLEQGAGTAPLHHLSLPSYAEQGTANNERSPDNSDAFGKVIDSEDPQTVWHRLYIEAVIPPHCGIRVFLAATQTPNEPVEAQDWFEHNFGAMYAHSHTDIPHGAWVSYASEIAGQAGLLDCEQVKDQIGLFTVLIQRPDRQVRSLRGRYLRVCVVLEGDGRSTPELAALRAYASRFSYVENYLPELYRESVFGPDADNFAPSTPADFFERFLDNFEGLLTPLEDRIAGAYLLTDAQTAPEEALEWLGSWIGLMYDPLYPPTRRRALLQAAPRLFAMRGTVRGLAAALEIATNGSVSGGEIVILEDFRLRRTFATILGADLEDEDDPLMMGLVNSGNSYVGDTLFLGDENRREFLAMFRADLQKSRTEQLAIAQLFDALAYRVTVLVHDEVTSQDLGLIRRIVEAEIPAHVTARVLTATYQFVVGMASLVGVDTYLGKMIPPQPVEIGRSHIGVRDYILRSGSLDPRLSGGKLATLPVGRRPTADAGDDQTVPYGTDFELDGSDSSAADGKEIDNYIWRMFKE